MIERRIVKHEYIERRYVDDCCQEQIYGYPPRPYAAVPLGTDSLCTDNLCTDRLCTDSEISSLGDMAACGDSHPYGYYR